MLVCSSLERPNATHGLHKPTSRRGRPRHTGRMVRSPVADAFVRSVLVLLAAGSGLASQEATAAAQPSKKSNTQTNPRRLQVLFLGAPTRNGPHHDPITRYATLKKGLGAAGIDLTYSEDPASAFTSEGLQPFDAVLLYGNWDQQGVLPEAQRKALFAYVENGGGFVPVHCASACWGFVGGVAAAHVRDRGVGLPEVLRGPAGAGGDPRPGIARAGAIGDGAAVGYAGAGGVPCTAGRVPA